MEIILWIIFGALVGWIASIIMRTNQEQGGLANIAVGILGAVVGGYVARALGASGVTGFNVTSFLVALAGAVALIGLYKLVTNGRHHIDRT